MDICDAVAVTLAVNIIIIIKNVFTKEEKTLVQQVQKFVLIFLIMPCSILSNSLRNIYYARF
jgi:hypothetical protein